MNNTLYIIENIKKPMMLSMKSFKLFGLKIWFYEKITKDLNIEIDFAYLLSDWFFEKKYKSAWRKDTLVYEQILKYLE